MQLGEIAHHAQHGQPIGARARRRLERHLVQSIEEQQRRAAVERPSQQFIGLARVVLAR